MTVDGFTRDLPTVEASIRALMATRATKVTQRDKREADMLSALHDVEILSQFINDDDQRLERLFAELDRAKLADRIEQAERLVNG